MAKHVQILLIGIANSSVLAFSLDKVLDNTNVLASCGLDEATLVAELSKYFIDLALVSTATVIRHSVADCDKPVNTEDGVGILLTRGFTSQLR